jgi:BirA family biotin operon repressor/biotin-[acetyl-CoA-carboxylase] ligase
MDVIKNYPPNSIIIADEQTRGRGKQDRKWFSEKSSNLYMSLAIEASDGQINYSNYSFLTAIAMVRTVEELTGGKMEMKTKWPNDILANGKKIGGILLERDLQRSLLVIGIGLNLDRHPEMPETMMFEPTDLKREGFSLGREEVLAKFLEYFDFYCQKLESQGFSPIRNDWLGYAYGFGKKIAVKVNSSVIEGIFEDLDRDGTLLLVTETGRMSISSADIF